MRTGSLLEQRQRSEFYLGAAAALAWLVTGGPGPLTGHRYSRRPVGGPAMRSELAQAELLTSTPLPRRRHYAIGVEHALLWAGYRTTVPPLPL